jgi:hypothetical protein
MVAPATMAGVVTWCSGRSARLGGALRYHRKKAVTLQPQQIQQLLISTMKHCPARLRLYAFAQLLQLFPAHLVLLAMAVSPSQKS